MTNSADPDQLAYSEPTDLDLHCLLRHAMSCSAREGIRKNIYLGWSFPDKAPDKRGIRKLFFLFLHENTGCCSH